VDGDRAKVQRGGYNHGFCSILSPRQCCPWRGTGWG
jgi:hypothetical protein